MDRTTPADLRAEIARQRATIYKLAAAVDVYPGRLGQMLNEHIPMPESVVQKLSDALRQVSQGRGYQGG